MNFGPPDQPDPLILMTELSRNAGELKTPFIADLEIVGHGDFLAIEKKKFDCKNKKVYGAGALST